MWRQASKTLHRAAATSLNVLGYFCVDSKDSSPGKPVFNRIVPLRDSWAKATGQGKG